MVLRRSRLERGAGRVVSRREMGARVVWRESGPLADWCWCDGQAPEGRRRAAWSRTVAGRLEAHCLHGRPADDKSRGYLQEIPAGVPRAITPGGVVLAAKAAVRDDNTILGRARRHLGAISDSRRGWPARAGAEAGDIPLQWSQDGRYLYTVDSVMGPGRRPLMSFAWSS